MADTTARTTPTPSTAAATSSALTPITTVGTTTINDSVVAKVAGIAAADVRGVHALGGGVARAIGALRGAVNQQDHAQGISVEVGEKQVAVDVSIVADYPVALQQVADDVRSSVISAVEGLVGLEVTEVNVTVTDVYIPSDDADDEAAEPARVQ